VFSGSETAFVVRDMYMLILFSVIFGTMEKLYCLSDCPISPDAVHELYPAKNRKTKLH
jgi:hypothetical protein